MRCGDGVGVRGSVRVLDFGEEGGFETEEAAGGGDWERADGFEPSGDACEETGFEGEWRAVGLDGADGELDLGVGGWVAHGEAEERTGAVVDECGEAREA
jgi:hypothetical protein